MVTLRRWRSRYLQLTSGTPSPYPIMYPVTMPPSSGGCQLTSTVSGWITRVRTDVGCPGRTDTNMQVVRTRRNPHHYSRNSSHIITVVIVTLSVLGYSLITRSSHMRTSRPIAYMHRVHGTYTQNRYAPVNILETCMPYMYCIRMFKSVWVLCVPIHEAMARYRWSGWLVTHRHDLLAPDGHPSQY